MNQLENLVELLCRLPGLGKKSAARMAYWMLQSDQEYNKALADNISTIQDVIIRCPQCGNYTDQELCSICQDSSRQKQQLCVVEQPQDVMNIESTGEFHGVYHVLHGVLAPLDGVGPEELGLNLLVERARELDVKEIIIATNPTLEGDSTALYIQRLFQDREILVTRIASGLPVGGDLEYADKLSLARSLRARTNF